MTAQPTETSTRALWQTTTCPDWCVANHHDIDGKTARECGSMVEIVRFTTEDALMLATEPDVLAELDGIHVGIEQGYREISPRITMYREDGTGYGLTLDEAQELVDHMQRLIAIAKQ